MVLFLLFFSGVQARAAAGDQWEPVGGEIGRQLTLPRVAPDGTLYGVIDGDGVYHSTDRAQNWTRLAGLPEYPYLEDLEVDGDGCLFAWGRSSRNDNYPTSATLFRLPAGGGAWPKVDLGRSAENRHLRGMTMAPDNTLYLACDGNLYAIRGSGQIIEDLTGRWYNPNGWTEFAFGDGKIFAGDFTVGMPAVYRLEGEYYAHSVPLPGASGSRVNALAVDAAGRIHAASNGDGGDGTNVFVSNDLGLTFASAMRNLTASFSISHPDLPGPPRLFYPITEGIVSRQVGEVFITRSIDPYYAFAAISNTALGVFRQVGDSPWEDVSAGLGSRVVSSLTAAPDGILYVLTNPGGLHRSTYLVPVTLARFEIE